MFFDKDLYLKRINCQNVDAVNLASLKQLQANHLYTVPFENLDIHENVAITLDIKNIFQKVVVNHRGGFCYELNSLFHQLLQSMGFNSTLIAAKVYASAPNVFGQAFDHIAIHVILNNKDYLVDVGFGEFALSPLEIENATVQHDNRGEFIIKSDSDNYIVYKQRDGNEQPEYQFDLTQQTLCAFSDMCEYHQTSPQSHFTQKRLISLATQNGRDTLSENILTLRNGESIKEYNISEGERPAILKKHFNVKMR